MNALDKVFVKRYKVGFRGTREYDGLVQAKNQLEARKKYAWERGIRITPDIVIKK